MLFTKIAYFAKHNVNTNVEIIGVKIFVEFTGREDTVQELEDEQLDNYILCRKQSKKEKGASESKNSSFPLCMSIYLSD